MALTLPPDHVIDYIHGPVTRVTRRIDIFESDGATLWEPNVGFTEGNVNIDISRPERRIGQFTLDNTTGLLKPDPGGGFWYDKILKVFRGVDDPDGAWETQIAELMIDDFDSSNHPDTLSVTCRDYTAKLSGSGSKFATSTTYPENHPIEEAIRDIAVSGGIDIAKIDLPLTGEALGREYVFDQGSDRWSAMTEIATSYNYAVFFTADGMLTMREHQDPFTTPSDYQFTTGQDGNMAGYRKSAKRTRIRNHIVAIGESASQVPVFAEATNTDPNSPTNVDRLGYMTEIFESSFIETTLQAQEIADKKLKFSALEQFDVAIESILVPYIEGGIIVEFHDPDPAPNDPIKFLLQTIDIPMIAGPMTSQAGRIISLGA